VPDLLDEVDKLSLAILLIIIFTPIASSSICTPAAFIIVAGMFISLILKIDRATVDL